jgi:ribonuclease J
MKKKKEENKEKVGKATFAKGFHFIPLGGSEEFGVNFNLYACDGKWMIFDCGIGFADHRFPGVDILLPDPSFIEDYKDDILGMVITHAHEDHVGAVPYLWPRLKCPIYCTKFTAAVLRAKFNDFPDCKKAKIIEIDTEHELELAPFKCKFIHVAHSIPQAVSTVIETSYGRVVHSGDWNLDPAPVIDTPTDEAAFRAAGDKGVLAYIGDSTNAPQAGRAGSEADVIIGLEQVFSGAPGRILVTIFASNIGRVQSICQAAQKVGRSVCLLGRSLHRMTSSARDCGYLKDLPDFISEEDLYMLPADQTLLIVTGSQGETQAALGRIARGDWRNIKLGKGDTAVFSSKAIPGNEKEINAVKNHLSASGVKIIDTKNAGCRIHVSGHPYRDEIADMYTWLKPQAVIPVHGERLMLEAQATLAREMGVGQVVIPNNGSVIRLAPEGLKVIDHVPARALAVEPNRIMSADHKAITERRKLQFSGAAHISVAIDARGFLAAEPHVTLIGMIDHDDAVEAEILVDIKQEVEDVLVDLHEDDVSDNADIQETLRVSIRKMLNEIFGFKPNVSIHLLRF